jgi:hypothetical protein
MFGHGTKYRRRFTIQRQHEDKHLIEYSVKHMHNSQTFVRYLLSKYASFGMRAYDTLLPYLDHPSLDIAPLMAAWS